MTKLNKAASVLGKKSAVARRKRLGTKGMSEAMRALAYKRRRQLDKVA